MKKKLSKSNHPTTPNAKKETTKNLVMGEYYCLKERQPRPVTMNFLRSLADLLLDWAEDEDSLSITEFFKVAKMGSGTLYEWIERCPELKTAHSYALDVIGARRETGAMRKKLDGTSVWKSQYHYGRYYREALEFAAQLSKKEQSEAGSLQITVKMDKVESDDKYFKKDS